MQIIGSPSCTLRDRGEAEFLEFREAQQANKAGLALYRWTYAGSEWGDAFETFIG